ncbi:hypothetical protein A3725_17565 [Alcanivorax sp. HI0035]|nr:hypothetical protein A3725_17565 [Alcanivorax sp. HI0035]
MHCAAAQRIEPSRLRIAGLPFPETRENDARQKSLLYPTSTKASLEVFIRKSVKGATIISTRCQINTPFNSRIKMRGVGSLIQTRGQPNGKIGAFGVVKTSGDKANSIGVSAGASGTSGYQSVRSNPQTKFADIIFILPHTFTAYRLSAQCLGIITIIIADFFILIRVFVRVDNIHTDAGVIIITKVVINAGSHQTDRVITD